MVEEIQAIRQPAAPPEALCSLKCILTLPHHRLVSAAYPSSKEMRECCWHVATPTVLEVYHVADPARCTSLAPGLKNPGLKKSPFKPPRNVQGAMQQLVNGETTLLVSPSSYYSSLQDLVYREIYTGYTGLLLDPAKGFGLRQKKKVFTLLVLIFGHFGAQ